MTKTECIFLPLHILVNLQEPCVRHWQMSWAQVLTSPRFGSRTGGQGKAEGGEVTFGSGQLPKVFSYRHNCSAIGAETGFEPLTSVALARLRSMVRKKKKKKKNNEVHPPGQSCNSRA
jgi:hypothetical protein